MSDIQVLISTYNGESFLREQIDSVLSQKECNVSILVRDDGSSDSTLGILEDFKKRRKLEYLKGDNIRPAKSFMTLLMESDLCDYYAFCDQDDIWGSDKLVSAINALKGIHEPAMYFSNARLVDKDGKPTGSNTYTRAPEFSFRGFVCSGGILGCTIVINRLLRDLIIRHGIPEQMIMHDYYIGIIAMLCGKVIYDEEPHMSYRQHGDNVVGVPTTPVAAIKDRLKFFEKKRDETIDKQAGEIAANYRDEISEKDYKFLQIVRDYKKNFIGTLRLALNPTIHFTNWKSSIFVRVGILLRYR